MAATGKITMNAMAAHLKAREPRVACFFPFRSPLGVASFSSCFSKKSNRIANRAAGIAPPRMRPELYVCNPRKIKSPRPPAPINPAMVATPIMSTVAVRMPPMMTVNARGSSTIHSTCRFVIPIPIPASMTERSTPRMPRYVLRKIGSSPYTVNAIIAGNSPVPTKGTKNTSKARLGIVWKTAVTPIIGSAILG